jgi:hypothetical protein
LLENDDQSLETDPTTDDMRPCEAKRSSDAAQEPIATEQRKSEFAKSEELRWQPTPLVRTCVATMSPVEEFRWMVWAEAKRRNFLAARRRAYLGDGAEYNWTIWLRHFSDFVPILDFCHTAGYLHGAAAAVVQTDEVIVSTFRSWVRAVWQGGATEVLTEMKQHLSAASVGDEKLPDNHRLRPLQKAVTYFSHHADKMNYPEYRRQGLPITTSLVESQIKEFNYRLKGSEKFWNRTNVEAMMQVVARTLRDDGRDLETFMMNRPGHIYTRRSTRLNQNVDSTIAA